MIEIKKRVITDRKDEKHNLIIYYKQNSSSNSDNSNSNGEGRPLNHWNHEVFGEIRKEWSFYPKTF